MSLKLVAVTCVVQMQIVRDVLPHTAQRLPRVNRQRVRHAREGMHARFPLSLRFWELILGQRQRGDADACLLLFAWGSRLARERDEVGQRRDLRGAGGGCCERHFCSEVVRL